CCCNPRRAVFRLIMGQFLDSPGKSQKETSHAYEVYPAVGPAAPGRGRAWYDRANGRGCGLLLFLRQGRRRAPTGPEGVYYLRRQGRHGDLYGATEVRG